MGQLYFLIGLPRSGKSFFAKKWVDGKINILPNNIYTESGLRYCTKRNDPRVIVCADDIRLSFGHRWNGHIEHIVHATKITMIKTLLIKHDVLVDGTHTTERSIKALLDIDNNAIPYILNTSVAECKKRAKETNQEDLYPIIDKMANQLLILNDSYGIHNNINSWRTRIYKPEIRD